MSHFNHEMKDTSMYSLEAQVMELYPEIHQLEMAIKKKRAKQAELSAEISRRKIKVWEVHCARGGRSWDLTSEGFDKLHMELFVGAEL